MTYTENAKLRRRFRRFIKFVDARHLKSSQEFNMKRIRRVFYVWQNVALKTAITAIRQTRDPHRWSYRQHAAVMAVMAILRKYRP